jgi:hypothetical protein
MFRHSADSVLSSPCSILLVSDHGSYLNRIPARFSGTCVRNLNDLHTQILDMSISKFQ